MVWVKVTEIKQSQYIHSDNYVICFDYLGKSKHSVISWKVLHYNGIESVDVGDEVFVIKSFNRDQKEIYLIKDVRKN